MKLNDHTGVSSKGRGLFGYGVSLVLSRKNGFWLVSISQDTFWSSYERSKFVLKAKNEYHSVCPYKATNSIERWLWQGVSSVTLIPCGAMKQQCRKVCHLSTSPKMEFTHSHIPSPLEHNCTALCEFLPRSTLATDEIIIKICNGQANMNHQQLFTKIHKTLSTI